MRFLRKTTVLAALAATAAAVVPAVAAPVAGAATSTHGGAPIVITTDKGSQALCTLNSVAVKGGTNYGVTAGHCLSPEELGGKPVKITTKTGQLLADRTDLQSSHYEMNGDASIYEPDAGLNDFAWFKLNSSVKPDVHGISSRPNTGIDELDTLLAAPRLESGNAVPVSQNLVGGIVCKDGAMTGRTCGPVLSVNTRTQEVFALIPAIAGDSGSPLYTLGADGKVHVVGTLSSGSPVLFNLFDGTQSHLSTVGK